MNYEQIKEELLNSTSKPSEFRRIFNVLQNLELENKITELTNNDIDEILFAFHSKSKSSVTKNFSMIRRIYRYFCNKKGVTPKTLKPNLDYNDYIDEEALRSVTIDPYYYNIIKSQLTILRDGKLCNFRDKLLFELPWVLGLSNREIKFLRKDDIKFINEHGKERCIIKIKGRSSKILREEDAGDYEVMEDIKKTLEETQHFMEDKNDLMKEQKLKDTPYLIRAIASNKSNSNYISNPSCTLQRILVANEVNIPDDKIINIEQLTIEDIRRSKIMYCFAKKGYTFERVREEFGKKTDCDLYWLRDKALQFYKNK